MNSLPILTEAQEADILVAWLRVRGYKFHHSPNETGGSPEAFRRAVRMKRQGTSPGYPDYTIIAGGHIIFIELKSKRGYASPEQKAWIEAINEIDNVEGFICRGAEAAIKVIEECTKPFDPIKEIGKQFMTLGTIPPEKNHPVF